VLQEFLIQLVHQPVVADIQIGSTLFANDLDGGELFGQGGDNATLGRAICLRLRIVLALVHYAQVTLLEHVAYDAASPLGGADRGRHDAHNYRSSCSHRYFICMGQGCGRSFQDWNEMFSSLQRSDCGESRTAVGG